MDRLLYAAPGNTSQYQKNQKRPIIRIAFISYEYPPETHSGGIGTYTLQTGILLAGANFDVHIFAGSNIKSGHSVENGVKVHRVLCENGNDFKINVLPVFEKEHTTQPFEIVESPEINSNALYIRERFPSLPLIVRLHAPYYLVEHFKKKYIPFSNKLRFVLGALKKGKWDPGYWRRYDYKNDNDFIFTEQADHISAPSIQMKEWAVRHWKIPANRITVTENPFTEKAVFKTARTENKEKQILFYGRLNVLKGLITATAVMKKILKNNPGWTWVIIGEDGAAADGKGSMKNYIQNELAEVKAQVTIHDNIANEALPSFLKQASVVLVPSLFESYSYVTIEAMTAGKAIVGSAGTGIASLITNNDNGKLADPYSVAEWILAVQTLIDNESLRQRLGTAAFKYAEDRHAVNKKIIEYYSSVLSLKSNMN